MRMCKVLKVSKSGFYSWVINPKVAYEPKLRAEIVAFQKETHQVYGHRRLLPEMKAKGYKCSVNKILRILREENIRGKNRKTRPYSKTPRSEVQIIPNILNRKFEVDSPDKWWVTDITYIWTYFGWVYLCVILDLFSRMVVGWAVSENPDSRLTILALHRAIALRRPGAGVYMHSDQGCQYTSKEYTSALERLGFMHSMSGRGQCWDNAPMESWNSTLKRESDIVTQIRTGIDEVESALFVWIESWYNLRRRHSKLGYCSPVSFEKKKAA
jgi:putative transposase